jgi:DNA processing protein
MAEALVPEGSRQPSLREMLALHLTAGVGAVTYRRLLKAFGSVQGVLAAPAARIEEVEGVGPKRAGSLSSGRGYDLADREMENAQRQGVSIVPYGAENYPPALRQIYDPPLVIYIRGQLLREDAVAVAVVGSRNASHYGLAQAQRFAGALAGLGFTVVSGLARGIDSAAHRAALDAGGRTVAVQGCGLAGVYPPENADLAEAICAHGAVVSELPLDAPPSRENFPRRNRLISGLSLGVLIVEGSTRSGSLITAQCAIEQGRDVFAVPGMIDNPLASGPNGLIRKAGAKLVEHPTDVLDELGPVADELVGVQLRRAEGAGDTAVQPAGEAGKPPRALEAGLNARESAVLNRLSGAPLHIDSIIEASGLAPAEVASALMVLEIRRLIKRLPGQRYIRLAPTP